jgi:antitoxin MazE
MILREDLTGADSFGSRFLSILGVIHGFSGILVGRIAFPQPNKGELVPHPFALSVKGADFDFVSHPCHHVYTMFLQGGGNPAMKTVVKKWGNSASVRIPAAILQAAKLRLEDSVDVREESGRIVIEPLSRKEYDLSELIKRITPENLHEEVDFGKPVGNEAW